MSQSPKKTIQETSIDPKSASRCVLNLTFWTKLSTFDRFLQKKKTLSSYFGMRQSPWALGGGQVAPFGGKTPGSVYIPRHSPAHASPARVLTRGVFPAFLGSGGRDGLTAARFGVRLNLNPNRLGGAATNRPHSHLRCMGTSALPRRWP